MMLGAHAPAPTPTGSRCSTGPSAYPPWLLPWAGPGLPPHPLPLPVPPSPAAYLAVPYGAVTTHPVPMYAPYLHPVPMYGPGAGAMCGEGGAPLPDLGEALEEVAAATRAGAGGRTGASASASAAPAPPSPVPPRHVPARGHSRLGFTHTIAQHGVGGGDDVEWPHPRTLLGPPKPRLPTAPMDTLVHGLADQLVETLVRDTEPQPPPPPEESAAAQARRRLVAAGIVRPAACR